MLLYQLSCSLLKNLHCLGQSPPESVQHQLTLLVIIHEKRDLSVLCDLQGRQKLHDQEVLSAQLLEAVDHCATVTGVFVGLWTIAEVMPSLAVFAYGDW
ncbi:hypothetical protein E2C01_046031 [Portunus trituberculatus]|uniref:Uncharacterized protein n=1 Tax=Portunus trituberculatus TaxID=210409 RepID=A0A5B7G3P4_PORTR|nr:hypothetical protein [Portunus trituberculatus]